ncbi:uncharacterized protein VTP21DRAFT_3259 [Calcarisporiella thermophila]|uniref:uncharacterized protein n=1 Tax=Calcarisporiella thermophila TaxID=911321 RepID=UPI003742420C
MENIRTKTLLVACSLYWLLAYLFLNWLPGRPILNAALILLAFYYISWWRLFEVQERINCVNRVWKTTKLDRIVCMALTTATSLSTSVQLRRRTVKHESANIPNGAATTNATMNNTKHSKRGIWEILFGTISAVNFIILLMLLDFTFRDRFFFAARDLAFTRTGAITAHSARVFVRMPSVEQLRIEYRAIDSDLFWKKGPEIHLEPQHDFTATVSLEGLQPNTRYEWRFLRVGDSAQPQLEKKLAPLQFVTPPAEGTPTRMRFGSGSCIKRNFPYPGLLREDGIPGFRWMSRHQMDLLVFLGDFIYADAPFYFGSGVENYRMLYRQIYATPDYQNIFKRVPSLHVYDDHEILNNWSSQDDDPMPSAMKAFWEYQGETNANLTRNDGVAYFEYSYGDIGFFFLDTRRYRSPSRDPDDAQKTMLGAEQKRVFKEWVARVNSTRTFKFVVSSVPLTRNWRGPDADADTWGGYLTERAELFDILKDVPNVFFISGDRHEVGVTQLPHGFIDFSTSPINQFYFPLVNTYHERDGEKKLLYHRVGNQKYAVFDIDTKISPPKFVYRLYVGESMEPLWEYEVVGKKVLN